MYKKISFSLLLFVITFACLAAFSQDSSTVDTSTSLSQTLTSTYKKSVAFTPTASVTERAPAPLPGAGSSNKGYVLFRLYVLKVHRGGPNVAVIETGPTASTANVPFSYGKQYAYKGEAGWNASNNFGFRVSYFNTNQKSRVDRTGAATAPFFVSSRPLNVTFTGGASTGTLATFRQNLVMDVFDLEGSYKWHGDNWTLLGSAGIRIARVSQAYTVEDFCCGNRLEDLVYNQKRTGIGPTADLDFRHKLGGSNVWWTGSGRFALVIGNIREASTYASVGITQSPTRVSSPNTWVIEGETGIEWAHKTSAKHEFFIDGNFVFHQWNSVVIATPVSAVGGNPTAGLDDPTLAPTAKGSIRFLGGSFSFGFRF